ncbi:hypothetical protein QBC47DRAFT_347954 [Echria macrotheca]|uniref:Uncharacterized protein n=1 Tax=Echria macrotheca TaxID=438768 RepID=A0AAJ0BDF7_9PEZI|nr:hypothetical protein QBC47DRAFT_347954 [Echria macrotheca]
MTISTAPQLRQTYQLWTRFSMPVDGGTRDAIAVPGYVASQLNSAYTILVTSMVMNLWCILFAIAFFYMLNRDQHHRIYTSLWNKRASLTDSLFEVLQPTETGHWRQRWIYPVLLVIFACWVAQNVVSIIVPPYIIVANAAPVNPAAILARPNTDTSSGKQLPPSALAELFSLEAPSALRAAGGAQVASVNTESKVSAEVTTLGTTKDGETIERIDYGYNVSGADLGLQKFPTLLLEVVGACTTEYGWLISSSNASGYTNDTYAKFGDPSLGTISLNIFDGTAPIAFFYSGPTPPGAPGNTTWAAFISSVDRVSYTQGTDPLYNTGSSVKAGLAGTGYAVKPRRPVLSCWQTDTWRYNGLSSTIIGLNSTALPGLDLSPGMQLILARYLGQPRIVSIGRQLGLSALLSSTNSIGDIFNAGSSSAFSDLRRLVLAAYIATANTLTDLTLYPGDVPDRNSSAGNLAVDESGGVKPGVAEFVVWSADITTLSVKAITIIPILAFILWLLALSLLRWSPLRIVNALDAAVLHKYLVDDYGARPNRTGTWHQRGNGMDLESKGGHPAESNSEHAAEGLKRLVTDEVKEAPREGD